MFILGFIVGALITLGLITLDYIFAQKGKNLTQTVGQKLEQKVKPNAEIFMPPSDEDAAREEVIERNEKAGVDTPLEDIL